MSNQLPTATIGAAIGTAGNGATAAIPGNASDAEGTLNITTASTGTATGVLATITLAGNYSFGGDSEGLCRPMLQDCSATGELGSLRLSARGTKTFAISCSGTPSASTAYKIMWSMRT